MCWLVLVQLGPWLAKDDLHAIVGTFHQLMQQVQGWKVVVMMGCSKQGVCVPDHNWLSLPLIHISSRYVLLLLLLSTTTTYMLLLFFFFFLSTTTTYMHIASKTNWKPTTQNGCPFQPGRGKKRASTKEKVPATGHPKELPQKIGQRASRQ